MPNELKTDSALLERLNAAAHQPMTPAEVRLQKISYILGSLSSDSTVTPAQVEEILAKSEGVPA